MVSSSLPSHGRPPWAMQELSRAEPPPFLVRLVGENEVLARAKRCQLAMWRVTRGNDRGNDGFPAAVGRVSASDLPRGRYTPDECAREVRGIAPLVHRAPGGRRSGASRPSPHPRRGRHRACPAMCLPSRSRSAAPAGSLRHADRAGQRGGITWMVRPSSRFRSASGSAPVTPAAPATAPGLVAHHQP